MVERQRSSGRSKVEAALGCSTAHIYNERMKLRIHGNSIRLRVNQSEVATLAAGGKLESWVQFVPSAADRLGYAIEISAQCSEVCASCSNGVLLVTLPESLAQTWASTNQVGIEYDQPTTDGSFLRIGVEKDFRCRHFRPGEDESDNFPNPSGGVQS